MAKQETDDLIAETNIPAEEPAGRPRKTTGDFFRDLGNNNRKLITWVLGGVLLVTFGILAFKYFYQEPLEQEGQNAIFKTQRVLEADSFNQALNGNGNDIPGMRDIASDYSLTKTGNLANYYTGVALMQKGQYDEALDYLKDFKTDSKILKPVTLGAIGDCYSQLKNYDDAAEYYMKAADYSDNQFTAPIYYKKAGLAYEQIGQPDKALKAYQRIKEKYKLSMQGGDIDKYIARAQTASEMQNK